jgi:hypothetical protein
MNVCQLLALKYPKMLVAPVTIGCLYKIPFPPTQPIMMYAKKAMT